MILINIMDYESIEEHLVSCLKGGDNLDVHSDAFFPVTLLDLLFHYSELSTRPGEPRNFHGHDFDRWLDNCVAATCLPLLTADGHRRTERLVDIDSVGFDNARHLTVTLPDGTHHLLLDAGGEPLTATSLDNIDINMPLEEMFGRHPVDADSEPFQGFGVLAHIVRVVCEKSNIDPAKADARVLSQRIFDHFKDAMLPLIPALWNDMEHIEHYARPTLVHRHA